MLEEAQNRDKFWEYIKNFLICLYHLWGGWEILVLPCDYIALYSFKGFILIIFHMGLRIILVINKAATFPTVWRVGAK